MGSPRFLSRRIAAMAIAGAFLFSTGALGGVAPARAATTDDPGKAAAGWLAAQVETGTLGPGSLADAILAFAAVGAGADAAADALSQLESGLGGYILDGTTLRPGALGKALLAVVVAGGNRNAFGGRDLEADLRGLIQASGQVTGASVFDQTMAVLALAATPSGAPSATGEWLATQQCPSGEYQWDGSCPASPGTEDPDTTALAVQALLATGETAAAGASVAWLLGIQDGDGAFSAYVTPNTNSTGVAGQALRAAGETAAADAAAAFVLQLQYGCGTDPASDIGAFAYAQSYAGYLIFSTPQAVLALRAGPLNELRIAGASADAPTFDCSVAPTPAPDGTVRPRITPPPTDAVAGGTPASGSPVAPWLVVAVLALVVGGGLAAGTRIGRPR